MATTVSNKNFSVVPGCSQCRLGWNCLDFLLDPFLPVQILKSLGMMLENLFI